MARFYHGMIRPSQTSRGSDPELSYPRDMPSPYEVIAACRGEAPKAWCTTQREFLRALTRIDKHEKKIKKLEKVETSKAVTKKVNETKKVGSS